MKRERCSVSCRTVLTFAFMLNKLSESSMLQTGDAPIGAVV